MPQSEAAKARQRRYRAKKRAEARVAAANINATQDVEEAVFDVEDAPEDTFPAEEKEGAFSKIAAALGLKNDTSEEKEQRPLPAAKLNKQQQAIFDAWTPLAISGFVLCAGWCWRRIEPEYGHLLAPSDEVATKIVAPLMRIYARMSKIGTTLNPNHVDAAAAMAALVGYAWTSINLWQEIQTQKAQEQEEHGSTARNNVIDSQLRASPIATDEGGAGNENARRSHIRRHAANANGASSVNGAGEFFDISNLTDVERRAYEKLSQLRERDYASRARRSGVGA